MAQGDSETPKKGWPWGRIALGISLALNLMVAGIVLGGLLSHRHDFGHDRRGDRFAEVGPYSRALDDEDRAALRQELRRSWPQGRQNRQAVRAGFDEVLSALRSEPFEVGRVEAVLTSQSERISDHLTITRGLLLDRMAQMSPDERAAFADRLEQVLRRGPPRR
ncbi:putative membrane protein [Rhodovulum iodosum]|uniref:Membrane protein n=1 Tax=Rhodovulum iodosum TaxID=68291 RepID=A0ABV3XPX8_9RHOB|nr:periplasmic heavy metal sensor [Rhodovulum robiginosum]RSK31551.1 periplasmic heavy metal sensor [Rhodovulum robiginosum]